MSSISPAPKPVSVRNCVRRSSVWVVFGIVLFLVVSWCTLPAGATDTANLSLSLTKYLEGGEYQGAPAPSLTVGTSIRWNYRIINSGSNPVFQIEVVDDIEGNISCPSSTLEAGQEMTCSRDGTAGAGLYHGRACVRASDQIAKKGYISLQPDTSTRPVVEACDVGYYLGISPTENATVFGWVFEDAELAGRPGIWDAGEKGIPGVSVILDGQVSGVTDLDGTYLFSNVTEGLHQIRTVPLAEYLPSSSQEVVFHVTNGSVVRVDFGELPAKENLSVIYGTVFEDANRNQLRDAEYGITNVTVTLQRAGLSMEHRENTTDDFGRFSFWIDETGSYLLVEQNKEGWFSTVAIPGSTRSIVLNADTFILTHDSITGGISYGDNLFGDTNLSNITPGLGTASGKISRIIPSSSYYQSGYEMCDFIETAVLPLTESGTISRSVTLCAADKSAILYIPPGRKTDTVEGSPLTWVSLQRLFLIEQGVEEGLVSMGFSYALTPEGGRVTSPILLTLSIPPEVWKQFDERDLVVMEWNGTSRTWEELPFFLNAQNQTLSCTLTRFSLIGVFDKQSTSPVNIPAGGSLPGKAIGTIQANGLPILILTIGLMMLVVILYRKNQGGRNDEVSMTPDALDTDQLPPIGLMKQEDEEEIGSFDRAVEPFPEKKMEEIDAEKEYSSPVSTSDTDSLPEEAPPREIKENLVTMYIGCIFDSLNYLLRQLETRISEEEHPLSSFEAESFLDSFRYLIQMAEERLDNPDMKELLTAEEILQYELSLRSSINSFIILSMQSDSLLKAVQAGYEKSDSGFSFPFKSPFHGIRS
jgi:hypothetical protein